MFNHASQKSQYHNSILIRASVYNLQWRAQDLVLGRDEMANCYSIFLALRGINYMLKSPKFDRAVCDMSKN